MQIKSLLSAVVAVASVGAAIAGVPAQVVTPAPEAPVEKALSVTVFAGYETYYNCRGLVASREMLGGDGIIPAGFKAAYKLDEDDSVLIDGSYTTILSGHNFMSAGVHMHNQTYVTAGWQNKYGLVKGLTTNVGWDLIHGGLLGLPSKSSHGRSLTQEFYVNLNQDFSKNWYAGVNTNYAFQGLTGWWFHPYVGYRTILNQYVSLNITANLSVTTSYMDGNASLLGLAKQSNGTQAWWLKAEAPIKTGIDNLLVVPFISVHWAGKGALKVNRQLPNRFKPYENFGIVVGAKVAYTF